MEQPVSVLIMKTISSERGACQYLYPGFHPSFCSLAMQSGCEACAWATPHHADPDFKIDCFGVNLGTDCHSCGSHWLPSGRSSGNLSSVHLRIGVHMFHCKPNSTRIIFLSWLSAPLALLCGLHVRIAHGGQCDPFSWLEAVRWLMHGYLWDCNEELW